MKKEIIATEKLGNDLTLLKSTLSPLDVISISRLINGNVDNKLLIILL